MKKITIAIPHCYVWMAQQSMDPKTLYKKYVRSYVRNTCPGWELGRIQGLKAIIVNK